MGADSELQILIKLAVQGDAEAKEKLKQVIATGTAEQKQSIEAYKGVLDGMEKEIDAHKRALGVQEETTSSVKKATEAKKQYREALKGLALEFPLLARVMSLLANPAGAVIAVLGSLIAALKNYTDTVREAGLASQAMEQAAVSASVLAAAHDEVARSTADFEEKFAKISGDADRATKALAEYNKMLLLKQQLEQALDDAKLAADVDRIEHDPSLSPAEKIRKIAAAQSAARGRSADREENKLQLQANADATMAGNEARRAQQFREQAKTTGAQLATANAAATAAADEAKAFPKSQEQARKENAEALETVRMLMEAVKGGVLATVGTIAMSPLDNWKLAKGVPANESMEETEARLLKEKAGLDAQAAAIQKRATDKQAEADQLKQEKADLENAARDAQKNSQDKSASAQSTWNELTTKRAARAEIEPITEDTAARKAARAAEEARRKELEGIFRKHQDKVRDGGNPNDFPSELIPYRNFIRNGELNLPPQLNRPLPAGTGTGGGGASVAAPNVDGVASAIGAGGDIYVRSIERLTNLVINKNASVQQQLDTLHEQARRGLGDDAAGLIG